jgi:ribosomal protein S18 acetylase RimI-like enzyme
MLMDASRDLLRTHGASYWTVGVVEINTGAVRFYEREGFQPYYRQLLGRIHRNVTAPAMAPGATAAKNPCNSGHKGLALAALAAAV